MNLQDCSDEKLINEYRNGSQYAIEVLFERYKNLVRRKAKAMYLAGGDNDDLIQEGMIGLYKAATDFSNERDASFATFASMCINRQLMTAVTKSNRKKYAFLNSYISLDTPASDEDTSVTLLDVIQPQKEQDPEKLFIDKEYTQQLWDKCNKVLSQFELEVLKHYVECQDYIKIAKILDKSPKSIDNALQRIRNKISKCY